jgi:thioredoxin
LNHDVLVHVNSMAEFERYVLQASKPCLADFYSDHCPPCRILGPIIENLAQKYQGRVVVCKVSLDSVPRLAARYNIMGIPTVLFLERGQEIHRLVGLRRQDDYTVILDVMIGKQ